MLLKCQWISSEYEFRNDSILFDWGFVCLIVDRFLTCQETFQVCTKYCHNLCSAAYFSRFFPGTILFGRVFVDRIKTLFYLKVAIEPGQRESSIWKSGRDRVSDDSRPFTLLPKSSQKSSFRKTCRVRHYLEAIRPMKVPGCGGWFPEFRKSHPLASIRWQMGHLSQGGQWSFRSNVQAKFRGGGVEELSFFFPQKKTVFGVFRKRKGGMGHRFFFKEKTQK